MNKRWAAFVGTVRHLVRRPTRFRRVLRGIAEMEIPPMDGTWDSEDKMQRQLYRVRSAARAALGMEDA